MYEITQHEKLDFYAQNASEMGIYAIKNKFNTQGNFKKTQKLYESDGKCDTML